MAVEGRHQESGLADREHLEEVAHGGRAGQAL
jgi:hypothetical protein